MSRMREPIVTDHFADASKMVAAETSCFNRIAFRPTQQHQFADARKLVEIAAGDKK